MILGAPSILFLTHMYFLYLYSKALILDAQCLVVYVKGVEYLSFFLLSNQSCPLKVNMKNQWTENIRDELCKKKVVNPNWKQNFYDMCFIKIRSRKIITYTVWSLFLYIIVTSPNLGPKVFVTLMRLFLYIA